jgi:hypothetical protein
MGKTAVLDDGDERFVVLKKRRPPFLNFESGEIVRKESPNRIASADFSGDGHREVLDLQKLILPFGW